MLPDATPSTHVLAQARPGGGGRCRDRCGRRSRDPCGRAVSGIADAAAAYVVVAAPWGPVHVAATSRGVAAIELFTPTERFVSSLESRLRVTVSQARRVAGPARELAERAAAAVESYLGG